MLNYMKKIEEDRDIRQMLTPEEVRIAISSMFAVAALVVLLVVIAS